MLALLVLEDSLESILSIAKYLSKDCDRTSVSPEVLMINNGQEYESLQRIQKASTWLHTTYKIEIRYININKSCSELARSISAVLGDNNTTSDKMEIMIVNHIASLFDIFIKSHPSTLNNVRFSNNELMPFHDVVSLSLDYKIPNDLVAYYIANVNDKIRALSDTLDTYSFKDLDNAKALRSSIDVNGYRYFKSKIPISDESRLAMEFYDKYVEEYLK